MYNSGFNVLALIFNSLPQLTAPQMPVAAPVEEPHQRSPQPQCDHWARRSGKRWPSRCLPAPLYHCAAEGRWVLAVSVSQPPEEVQGSYCGTGLTRSRWHSSGNQPVEEKLVGLGNSTQLSCHLVVTHAYYNLNSGLKPMVLNSKKNISLCNGSEIVNMK